MIIAKARNGAGRSKIRRLKNHDREEIEATITCCGSILDVQSRREVGWIENRKNVSRRCRQGQLVEVATDFQGRLKHFLKSVAVNFDSSKLTQMIGDELGVEQRETACDKASDKVHQRDL